MKLVLLAAALGLSGVAVAHPTGLSTAQATTGTTGQHATHGTTGTTGQSTTQGTMGTTGQGTTRGTMGTTGQSTTGHPMNHNTGQMANTQVMDGSPPERDARGIPVISAPAMVPPGANQPFMAQPGAMVVPNPNASAAFATQQSTKDYPVCSRTVTDGCVQAYERGVRNPG